MPPLIGRPSATARIPYDLPCDSMVVPRGQTTIIHGLSVVNFGPGSRAGGKIVVKGKLVIEGKPGNPAYLAGSLLPNVIGIAPGDRPWSGIQADSGAILRISHARFYYASEALVLSSKDVILKNCFFKGASALVLPDTRLALNPVGQSLSSLDLREGWLSIFQGGSAAVPPAASADADDSEAGPETGSEAGADPAAGKREKRSRLGRAGKWVAGAVGVLAVSGGAAWMAWQRWDAKSPAPAPAIGGLDAAPALPEPAAAGH
jgi:hypothetical protein